MPDFSALHVALSGLRAAQIGMDTASHNVANANTPGHTRQRVELTSRYPRLAPEGQIGLGVQVDDVARVRDAFLDARYRSSVATDGALDVRSQMLSRAELLSGEPDQGITAALSGLWDSFEDLALDPTDIAGRVAALEHLDAVAARFNDLAAGLEGLEADARVSLEAVLTETNDLLTQVAALNVDILDAAAEPGTPNDLMDQRDLLLDRLSRLVGATGTLDDNGAMRVSIGGIALVSGTLVRPLEFDETTGQILHPSGVAVVPGGEARGYQMVITDDIPSYRARLDELAVDTANALNSVHTAGFSPSGPGGDLLGFDPTAPALTLRRVLTDPADFATSGVAGPPFPEFDATVPEGLAALRNELVAAGGTLSLAGSMRAFVADLGQDTASVRSAAATQEALSAAADRARTSAHGVSVDEEMVKLMEFQRMYEAAARVITAVDEALDTVINRMGAVGR